MISPRVRETLANGIHALINGVVSVVVLLLLAPVFGTTRAQVLVMAACGTIFSFAWRQWRAKRE